MPSEKPEDGNDAVNTVFNNDIFAKEAEMRGAKRRLDSNQNRRRRDATTSTKVKERRGAEEDDSRSNHGKLNTAAVGSGRAKNRNNCTRDVGGRNHDGRDVDGRNDGRNDESIVVVALKTVVQSVTSNRWHFNFERARRGGQINFL